MPEEVNRVVTDHLAELCFLHSDEAIQNLRAEGVDDGRMLFVGNTMIDTLVALEDRFRARGTAASLELEPGGYLLVTLHRPSLVDGPLLADAMAALGEVARELPVFFPVHPRTRARLDGAAPPGVTLGDPVGYLDFLSLEADAAAVLTDSGGIQEETTYLGVPCFTLRDNTERPVTLRAGTNTLLGLAPQRIAEIPALLAGGDATEARGAPPMWDGRAAQRAVDAIERWSEG
jgi:UDP-N-acetylglucosamine 2-epimerase (non-hydrolysing)